MPIFAKSEVNTDIDDYSLKVLFLHGLEGSSSGDKSIYLKTKWGASSPIIRTSDLRSLREDNPGTAWNDMPEGKLKSAIKQSYADASAAVAYLEPDIVIGSSLGGALLAKLIVDKKYNGPAVFLAPAISELCSDITMPTKHDAVWVIGELDETISNSECVKSCVKTGGSLLVSQHDNHRLHKALKAGLIDVAIITALQLSATIL